MDDEEWKERWGEAIGILSSNLWDAGFDPQDVLALAKAISILEEKEITWTAAGNDLNIGVYFSKPNTDERSTGVVSYMQLTRKAQKPDE